MPGAMNQPVTIDDLDRALDTVAELIDMGERQYLPLFERLEREHACMERQASIADRASARLANRRNRPSGPGPMAAQSS